MATIYDIKIQFNEKGVDERNLDVDSTEKIGGFFKPCAAPARCV